MEAAAGMVLPPLLKRITPKIDERLSYVFSNKTHIEELKKEVKELEKKMIDIGGRVDNAQRQGGVVLSSVDEYQKEVDVIITDSKKFLEETRNFDATCFFKLNCNVFYLYKNGKQAAKLHKKVIQEYHKATGFVVVADPPPIAPIVVSSAATSGQEFKSREELLNEVISALQDEAIDVVGIHGMGGVGKTTLVDKLIFQARERKLFTVFSKANVSKTPNIRDIQSQIADRIQFKFQAHSVEGRVDELNQVLSRKVQNNEKILVVLDDVWDAIDITAQIGIPRVKCCKVVITTRMTDILRGGLINAHRIFRVGVLEEEEAKVLFAKSLGDYYSTIANDLRYIIIMEHLLKRCGGLPLALVTLAGALKGKDHHIWEDALDKLINNSGKKIKGMSEKVWSTIMFSIDSLQNEEVKKFLLLCSLFPEDAKIPVQKLVSYGFGIDLFEDSCKLDRAMRQVHGFIDKLVSCSLLSSTKREYESDSYCVQVHDVIRDVALDIASQDRYNFFTGTYLPKRKDLHAISLSVRNFEYTERGLLDASKLRVLRIQCEKDVSISINFSKGMEKLKVLDFVVNDVVSFSILDPLTSLEHLFMEGCTIMELTTTFEGFKCLKVLDLSRCNSDVEIPTNFIAGLLQLEGLFLANGQFINLVELQWCPRLQILHATLKVIIGQQIPHEVASILKHLSSFKLVISRYDEYKHLSSERHGSRHLTDKLFPKSLVLLGIHGPILISIIDILPKGLQSLRCYQAKGLTDLKRVESSMLRELEVHNCKEISYLFGAGVGLSKLEYISLLGLPLFDGICETKELPKIMSNVGTSTTSTAPKTPLFPPQELVLEVCTYGIGGSPAPQSASFSQLRVLEIHKLPRVTSVFPSVSLYKQAIASLRHLDIEDCESLEEVIASAGEGDEMDVAYPITLSLESLRLRGLSRLLYFYGGKHTLGCPLLQEIHISACYSFMSLAAVSTKDLGRLRRARITSCNNMKYVFSAHVEFSTLHDLKLRYMPEFEKICGHDGGALWKNSFPALQYLVLDSLPKFMNNIITDSHGNARKYLFGPEDVLPAIILMELSNMGCAEIWHFPPTINGSFSQLCKLEIIRLPHIKYVFPSVAFCTQLLTRLQGLCIYHCENLEEVVFDGGEEEVEDNQLQFPSVQLINLRKLPKLKHIYGGRHTMKFPNCSTIYIQGCESMKSIPPVLPDISMSKIPASDQDSHEAARKYLFGPKDVLPKVKTMYLHKMGCVEIWHLPPATGGSFSQLRYLEITEMPHIKYVFPSIAFCTHLLTRLKKLEIEWCENLEEVVYDDSGDEQVEDKDVANQQNIISVFPAIEEINLQGLPKLKHFYGGKSTLKFPNWRQLTIRGCESMISFSPVLLDAPNLSLINGNQSTPEISISKILATDQASDN